MASTTSKEDIATRAFVMIGANPVTDFSSGTTEADLANTLYEEIVQAELGNYEWNFAKATVLLSRNAAAPTNAAKWSASYRVDVAAIEVRGVFIGGNPIEYEHQENNILCDATEDDAVYMEYLSRPDEGDWPPPFQLALIYRLAADFAGGLARDGSLVQAKMEQYEKQFRQAKKMDAQGDTAKRFRTRRMINVRGGGGHSIGYN